jgi:hypothetical protein
MGAYDHLFITDVQDCRRDMVNEGEGTGRPLPPNLSLPMALMRSADVPEAKIFAAWSWISPEPEPVDWVREHIHDDTDEVLVWMGGDPADELNLGAELFMEVEGERTLTTTTGGVFIPRGTRHCPLGFNHVEQPFNFIAFLLSGDYVSTRDPESLAATAGVSDVASLFVTEAKDTADDFTNEGEPAGYVRPANAGIGYGLMRQADVPASTVHMAYNWIHPTTDPALWVHPHRHDHCDELLCWMGGDPADMHDLGAELYLDIEGERHTVTTSGGAYIPKGTKHCPLGWNRVERPFRFMSILLSPVYESVALF